eukprot:CAMPEP_0196666758 /NCGR_PEP_ID=MMETSP1086-20130531/64695_1 /TAXON_ID=77921 /ORGANISM="Cyanoptyche  gloeocystis , Strain SAG4.97" /LENGTH=391 /DNA_ID=CAMNT_0042003995 /DNA_START=48 /DNA_END=1223 /DNA_ORIENTATION=-
MSRFTSPESANAEGNQLFVDEKWEAAVEKYSLAIELESNDSTYYRSRAAAHMKLSNFTDAVSDASTAIKLNPQDSIAYHRKGVACFELGEYETAKSAFEQGNKIQPSDPFKTWIRKCDAEIREEAAAAKVAPTTTAQPAVQPSAPAASTSTPASRSTPDAVKPTPSPQPKPAESGRTRHEFYQSSTHVFVSVFAKGVDKDLTKIDYHPDTVSVTTKLNNSTDWQWDMDLWDPIDPADCSATFSPTKIELKLKKAFAGRKWEKLEVDPKRKRTEERDGSAKAPAPAEPSTPAPAAEKKPSYPSSSKHKVNWDEIDKEVDKELAQEKPSGDESLTKLFQDIFSKGDENTKRAMMKSFSESGGTVLSTNWNEVGKKPVECTPPSGMEAKSWKKP